MTSTALARPRAHVVRAVVGDLSVTDGRELRFNDDPPAYAEGMAATAMLASSTHRMPMPCTVDIGLPHPDSRRRWMTAGPLDDENRTTRTAGHSGAELSVRAGKVSIAYRRRLTQLALAALPGPSADAGALGVAQRREHSA